MAAIVLEVVSAVGSAVRIIIYEQRRLQYPKYREPERNQKLVNHYAFCKFWLNQQIQDPKWLLFGNYDIQFWHYIPLTVNNNGKFL